MDVTISIHSPLAGRDLRPGECRPCRSDFNPLAPRGARLSREMITGTEGKKFQSTRPSRGETLGGWVRVFAIRISIHSPLAGRDGIHNALGKIWYSNFNPLAPRGARPRAGREQRAVSYFNPLAPRGARPARASPLCRQGDFNPLAPRGARLWLPRLWPE